MLKCFLGWLVALMMFTSPAFAEQLVIASASSLRPVVEQLSKAFIKQQPGTRLAMSSASSGTLSAQVKQGAPFDIFFAASEEYALAVDPIKHQGFAEISLVVASQQPYQNLAEISTLRDKSIGIANPASAPVGELGWQFLEKHQLTNNNRIIRSNNAQLALQNLERQLVDIALVSSAQLANNSYHTLPAEMPRLAQHIVLLRNTATAEAFYQFVLSPDAESILLNNGFTLLKKPLKTDAINE